MSGACKARVRAGMCGRGTGYVSKTWESDAWMGARMCKRGLERVD